MVGLKQNYMDIQEVAKLEKGTKVYQVDGTVIRGLFY
jgi:hypothetical protein